MKLLSFLLFCILIISCVDAKSSNIDFYTINFKSGMPSEHGDFKTSLNASWGVYSRLIKSDASLLISLHSKYRFKIVGFTDSQECKGCDCMALSTRRAMYVRDWLVANGVPADELDPPEGRGADTPLDSNESPAGRQRNRRVEINFIIQ
jgi:outer membrane protein OmpA-like peptidoglycan-associated protein